MNIIDNLSKHLKEVTGMNNEYFVLIVVSLIVFIGVKVINKIINKIYRLDEHSGKNMFTFRERTNIFANIIIVILLFSIWEGHLKNIVTIISFVAGATTLAIREVILNLTAGLYIKMSKPFKVEDRIEIDNIKGDVVLISALSFKVLELKDRLNGEQSSGIIVNIPNSKIFSNSLKNYTTAFKYIWSELVIPVSIDSDINKTKKILYKVVNHNEVIKAIPKKMDKAIDEAKGQYRIYYNNLKPIIYTEYKDNHIEFTIRFLVHIKKERNVTNDLWENILEYNKLGVINLYKA